MNLQFLGSSPLLASGRQYGLWPETGFLEIGPPLSPRVYLPEAGRLVVTTHYKRAPFGGDFDRRSLRRAYTSLPAHGMAQLRYNALSRFMTCVTQIEIG